MSPRLISTRRTFSSSSSRSVVHNAWLLSSFLRSFPAIFTGACGLSSGSALEPGRKRMHPFSVVESSMASQHVHVLGSSSIGGQYARSWCHAKTLSGEFGLFARSWS